MHGVVSNDVLGEPEIRQFEAALIDKDVLGFDIAMNDAVVDQLLVADANLLEVVDGCCLRVMPDFFKRRFQIATITELLNDVVVVGGLQDVYEAHYGFALELPHDLNFAH